MDRASYERILKNIITQAPLECGVQTLVYMLLDEIIMQKYENQVKVLVADLRDNNSIFGGAGGVLDLCIVNEKFEFVYKPMDESEIKNANLSRAGELLKKHEMWEVLEEEKKEKRSREEKLKFRKENLDTLNRDLINKFPLQRGKRYGCVEVKAVSKALPDDVDQLAGHIVEFKKVLYTNGVVWQFFDMEEFEDKEKNFLENYVNLRISESVVKKIENKLKRMKSGDEKTMIEEKLKEAQKETNELKNQVAKMLPAGENSDWKMFVKKLFYSGNSGKIVWEVQLVDGASKLSCVNGIIKKVEINEKKFNELSTKLSKIDWFPQKGLTS